MRRSTLIAAALIVMSGNVAAQKRFAHKAADGVKTAKTHAKAAETQSALFMPLHEEVYFYEGGTAVETGSYDYIYDTRGNVLESTYANEEGKTVTKYEYNANNQWITQREYVYDEDGKLLTDMGTTTKKTRAFDAIVTDLVVETAEYDIAKSGDGEETWSIVDRGSTWRRNVTRDAKSRVTAIEVCPYYGGDYEPMRRTAITYNAAGLAETWKYEELNYNLTWDEAYLLTGMEWYRTDGQITVEDDLADFFAPGNNRLKKANVQEGGVDVGRMSATYEENGNYTYVFDYFVTEGNAVLGRDVFTVTYTDGNGSMTEEMVYYEDLNGDGEFTADEVVETSKTVAVYDEKGEIAEEQYYADGELVGGAKYEYVYGEYAYPTEMSMSEYDVETGKYMTFMKVVRSNYVDVTISTGIGSVAAPQAEGVPGGVYNLQGVRVSDSADGLPAGLYIVKKDGRTLKTVRR